MKILRLSQRRCLTFWHWSSVTPYTSSCEFAGSCVFDKQSPGILSLRPQRPIAGLGQALFRSYGHFFAEFLGDLSLVRLALLELITCVGLRYGSQPLVLRDFSWKRALLNPLRLPEKFSLRLRLPLKAGPGFSREPLLRHERQIQ